jgi:O-antigen/teichoic acid export membrane protein
MKEEQSEVKEGLGLIAHSSFVILIGIIFSKVLTYIYRIIIARYYGPEVYGLFSLSLVIAGAITALASLGLQEGAVRYISIYRAKNQISKIKKVLNYTLYLSLLGGILGGTFLFLASESLSINLLHEPGLIIYLKIFSITIPILLVATSYLSLLKAYERMGIHSLIFNIIQNIAKVVSLILLILIGFNLNAVAISYFLGILTMAFFAYYLSKKTLIKLFKTKAKVNSKKIILPLISYSWPLMFFYLFSYILLWIDTFSIGVYKSAQEVGIYNAVVPIALLITLVSDIILQRFMPLATAAYTRNKIKLVKEISKQINKWIFAFGFPVAILFLLFPHIPILILFGPEYLEGIRALQILTLSNFIVAFIPSLQQLLLVSGRSKLVFYNIVGVSLFNLTLNMVLIPKENILSLNNSSGLVGAAISTTLAVLLWLIILIIQIYKIYGFIPFRRKTLRIVFSSLIPGLIVGGILLLTNNLSFIAQIFLIILYLLSYSLLSLLFKSLDAYDFATLKNMFFRK